VEFFSRSARGAITSPLLTALLGVSLSTAESAERLSFSSVSALSAFSAVSSIFQYPALPARKRGLLVCCLVARSPAQR